MSEIFISYARSTAREAGQVAEALRGLGYGVWLDDELPAHRSYSDVIEERLKSAGAVVVIWSAEAVKSHWVRAEANAALEAGTLVQLSLDGVMPPMPFNQIQCADLNGWSGDLQSLGWRKVAASVGDLIGGASPTGPSGTQTPPPLPSKPSIAVLPFANLSGDPGQDYFADGMVEEIAAALSRAKSIFVIGGASGLSFKGKSVTAREAARTLGVRYVLEGSVRNAGNRVRIAVKLIDGADGAQIWADRFEDTLDDVFALQDKVALAVAGVIEPAVREAEIRRASARPTDNMGSYDLCLRAQALYRSIAKSDVFAAKDLLDRAIAMDADYGWALALAVSCQSLIILYRWSDDRVARVRETHDLIERAIKASGNDAAVLAHVAMAMPLIGGDPQAAKTLADRAQELNPGAPTVWVAGGVVRMRLGEPEVAFEHFATALRLDPLSPDRPIWVGQQGYARFAQKRFREAIELTIQSVQLRPDWPMNYAILAASHGHLGELVAGRDSIARFRVLTSVDMRTFAAPGYLRLFLDGIALAEEKIPPKAGADRT
ncbi:MAG TPA: TIR domain-containing protein [Caulobacteraceae bacterium]